MAVGAKKGLARFPKAFHVHRMADAGPGRAEPQAEPLAGTAQKQVIVRVAVVGLQQVVVNVLRGQFSFDLAKPHGLQLEHNQGTGCILGQRLIDVQPDFLAGLHRSRHQV